MNALDLHPLALLAGLGAVTLGAVVQRSLGMGFGQVAAPLLLLIHPAFVPTAIILMGAVVAGYAAVKERARADRRQVAIAMVGRLTGSILAGWLLVQWLDTVWFSRMFAAVILFAVATSLRRWPVPLNGATLLTAGTFSGFMGTVTSVGAPPMGLVYQNMPGPMVRPTLNLYFAIGSWVSLSVLWWHGLLGARDMILALSLLPGVIFGTWLGGRLTDFVDARFRPLVLAICIGSAVTILVKSVL